MANRKPNYTQLNYSDRESVIRAYRATNSRYQKNLIVMDAEWVWGISKEEVLAILKAE